MNYIKLSGYHDCVLFSISSDPVSKDVRLFFFAENARQKIILLRGCKLFRSEDFILQNVVSRVVVYSGEEADRSEVVEKLKWASRLSDSSSSLSEDRLNIIFASIKSCNDALVCVEPSWGAQVVALCKSFVEIDGGAAMGAAQ